MKRNEDEWLKERLDSYKPKLADNDAFMASLTKKLVAVEYVKQYQAQQLRRNRSAVAVALVVGMLVGGLAVVCLPLQPLEQLVLSIDMPWSLPVWAGRHLSIGLRMVIMGFVSYCIVNLASALQNLFNWRDDRGSRKQTKPFL